MDFSHKLWRSNRPLQKLICSDSCFGRFSSNSDFQCFYLHRLIIFMLCLRAGVVSPTIRLWNLINWVSLHSGMSSGPKILNHHFMIRLPRNVNDVAIHFYVISDDAFYKLNKFWACLNRLCTFLSSSIFNHITLNTYSICRFYWNSFFWISNAILKEIIFWEEIIFQKEMSWLNFSLKTNWELVKEILNLILSIC